jgi:hypothetical protein
LKDCESKDTLLNVVKDCFDNKEKAIANEEELTATLDAMWVEIRGDSLGEIAKAFDKLSKKGAPATNADTDPQNKDSDPDDKDKGKKDEEANKDGEPKDDKDKGKKDEEANKDGEPKDDKKNEKDGCNKDSAPAVATKDDILAVIKDALPELVQNAVKDVLGIKTNDSQPAGIVNDSATNSEADSGRDYASFID